MTQEQDTNSNELKLLLCIGRDIVLSHAKEAMDPDAFMTMQRDLAVTGFDICTFWFQEIPCCPHLDWRKVIKEEYSRHVLPLLNVSSLKVLCYRVLIAIYSLVLYINVHGWHYLDKGSMYFCSHCNAWALHFHQTLSKASKLPLLYVYGIATCRWPSITGSANDCRQRQSVHLETYQQ